VKLVVSFATAVTLARLLSPEDYGLVGMVGVFVGIAFVFKDVGLGSATVQRAELTGAQVNTLFWVNAMVGLALAILTAASAPIVSRFYGEPRLLWITLWYAPTLLVSSLTLQHEALLRRRMRFRALALADLFAMGTGVAVAIVLAWHGAHYWALVANALCQGFAYGAALCVTCRWLPGLPARRSGVRPMLAFGGNLTGFSIVNHVARSLDKILIGRYWGSEQVGLYERAYQVLLLPIQQINAPISNVAISALSRLVDSPERYRIAYLRILEKLAVVTMPLMMFLIASSDWIVLLLLGPKWNEVSRIFTFLGIAGVLQPICNTSGWLFVTQGRTRQMFQWGSISVAVMVASIVAGLPWGAVGVAASYSLVYVCIAAPLQFWFMGREGPVRVWDIYMTIAPCACASVAALLALIGCRRWFVIQRPIAGIAMNLVVTVVCTLAVLVVIPKGRRVLEDLLSTGLFVLRGGAT
jgi:PST family polysaccharide transporter